MRKEMLAEDADDPGYQMLPDSKIVAEVNGEPGDLPSDAEGVDESAEPTVSNAKAYEPFDTALKWLKAQNNVDTAHLFLVKKWRDIAAVK